jgi:hypothetical protein
MLNLDKNKIIEMYNNNHTIVEIENYFNCSGSPILKILKDNNVVMRKDVRRYKDLTDKKYNLLSVVEYVGIKKGTSYWLCVCDCGNKVEVSAKQLMRKDKKATKSCGCLNHKGLSGELNPMFGKRPKSYIGPEKVKIHKYALNAKHRASKRNQTPELTEVEKKKVILYYRISKYLGEDWHVDHIQPISKGGLHHPDNLQVIPATENLKKNNKINYVIPEHLCVRI